ncbi:hypothetical protein EDB86DRAFT_2833346 [Lactarius hatsudake]|nr:hypothetical protein EDB86DRAFT_2833346 [Lactarius hatsudake]
MPPRHLISHAPSGQPSTTGTPSGTPPLSAASPPNPPSESGQPTPSVTEEVQPRWYHFLKKRTPAPDMPPPPVPMPPPSAFPMPPSTVSALAAVSAAHIEVIPPQPPDDAHSTFLHKPIPIKLQDTTDSEIAPIPDNSQETAASTALILGQSLEVVLVSNESQDMTAPEASHVPGESQATAVPGSSRIPNESRETTVPEVLDVPSKSWDTAAPGLSRVPDEPRETTASVVANVPGETQDTTALDAVHVPDEPQVVEGSDGEDKMDTESASQDEQVVGAAENNLLPRYQRQKSDAIAPHQTARMPYPDNLQSGRHFPAGYRRLLANYDFTNITLVDHIFLPPPTIFAMQSESDHPSKHSSGESEVSVPSTRALGDRFSVTPQDASILKRYVEEFQKADTETRKTILEKAMGELYATRPPNATFDKKEAKRKIRTWFYNHYSHPHRQLIKFTWKWSARNAFYHENKEEVMELAKKMSGGIPGSQAFLGALQDAMTSLWRELSSEGQEPYVEIAKEWSEDKPPRDVQAKMAQAAFRGRIVRDFQTQLFKTCGMRSIVLVAYADKDGKPRAAMDDWNKVLDDGMSFSDFCPNWRNAMIWQEWMKYCRTSFAPDLDQSITIGRSKTLKTKVKLITDADGEPEIPSVTLEDGYSTKVVQTALRDYCHAHILRVHLRKEECDYPME